MRRRHCRANRGMAIRLVTFVPRQGETAYAAEEEILCVYTKRHSKIIINNDLRFMVGPTRARTHTNVSRPARSTDLESTVTGQDSFTEISRF